MANVLGSLANQIQYLREIIERILTKELMGQLSSLLKNIDQTIGNPEFQKNIAEVIAQIKDALSSINSSGLISDTDALIKRVKEILDNIDNEQVAAVFSDISTLIHRAIETDVVGKLAKMLETINSLSGLKQFAKYLTASGVTLFSAAGPLGALFLKLISKGLDTNDTTLLKQILELEREKFFVQIMQLRTENSINYTLTVMAERTPGKEPIPDNILRRIIDERNHSERMLALPMMDSETIDCLKIAAEQCEYLIRTLYNPTKEAKKVDTVLDNICIASVYSTSWPEIVHGSVFQLKNFDEKIIFNREELSYKQAQRLYGKQNVSTVMKQMASQFAKSGGDDLYYAIANTQGSAPDEFTHLIQTIPFDCTFEEGFSDFVQQLPEKHREAINKLSAFYHDAHGAFHFTLEKWNELRTINPNLPALTEEASKVIILRALLEHARTTGRYFFAPHNLLREVGNGTFDFFSGVFNTVRHPVDTVTNTVTLPYDLITNRNNRRTALGSTLYNHPTRVATSLLITGGASFLASGAIGGINSASSSSTAIHVRMSAAHPGLAFATHPSFSLGYANTSASISLIAKMSQFAKQDDEAEEKNDDVCISENKNLNDGSVFDLEKSLEETMKSREILIEIAQNYHIDISELVSTSPVKADKKIRYGLFHQTDSSDNAMEPTQSDSEPHELQSCRTLGRK